jgi:hypothetical protein
MSTVNLDVVPQKVWVIKGLNPTTKKVEVYGTGQYLGRLPVGDKSFLNPYMELDDNRGHVWGYMCWWTTSEEKYKLYTDNYEVELVDPPANTPTPYTEETHA